MGPSMRVEHEYDDGSRHWRRARHHGLGGSSGSRRGLGGGGGGLWGLGGGGGGLWGLKGDDE